LASDDRPPSMQRADAVRQKEFDPTIGLALATGGIDEAIDACRAVLETLAADRAMADAALAAHDWPALAVAAQRLQGLSGHLVGALAARAKRAAS
jgi:hypothetical protein